MFMAGENTRSPELRAASIKGNMRFIWRAIQRAGSWEKLREAEGKLFGNAYGGTETLASGIKIRLTNIKAQSGSECMVPHRKLGAYDGAGKPFPSSAIKQNSTFDVEVISFGDEQTHKNYVRLFTITCMLYGFGRRSRKGFGTVNVKQITGAASDMNFKFEGAVDNLNVLSQFRAEYTRSGDKIVADSSSPANYPYIESIKLAGSKGFKETMPIIQQIGLLTHVHNGRKFLGDSRPRYASSILLSTTQVEDEFRCIVTQLHCTKRFDSDSRSKFYQDLDGRLK